jgi:hypothetical protein
VLLVIAYSRDARQSLRNVCRAHEQTVQRQFGRVALFRATEFGAFQALRLQEKHGEAVQIQRTEPFNEFAAVRSRVREAARAYEQREQQALPYAAFASGAEYPDAETMKETDLWSDR